MLNADVQLTADAGPALRVVVGDDEMRVVDSIAAMGVVAAKCKSKVER